MSRAILIKSYKHPLKRKPWPIGQVVQGTTQWISDLVNDGYAKIYSGEYPPKDKVKTDFFKPK